VFGTTYSPRPSARHAQPGRRRAYDPAARPRRSTDRQISARIGVSATTRAAQSSGNSISTLRAISLVGQPNLRASARVMRSPLDTKHFTIFAKLRQAKLRKPWLKVEFVGPRLRPLGTPALYAGMSCLPSAEVESSAWANLGPHRISPQHPPLLLPDQRRAIELLQREAVRLLSIQDGFDEARGDQRNQEDANHVAGVAEPYPST